MAVTKKGGASSKYSSGKLSMAAEHVKKLSALTRDIRQPKEPGASIDLVYEMQDLRRVIDEISKGLKATEHAHKEELLKEMGKAKLDGARGSKGQVTIKPVDIPQVEDWPKFYKYVAKQDAWDMLQRRLNNKAVTDRWEAKEVVAGMGKFTAIKITVTKRA